ncbi:hypothetical protein A2291_01975 [candidate division WOR-1 bacterium RIFOXYB2_FULL_42_35]|uniref:Bacterial surface antigen (D15) domain-containing protein n=1 Tax=candidate division WOR-1 bacterium RIFOXYC2_FULL_41_25 TaxID=1802586 RepID=A0A1F4TQ13_UNCSA|nr:MAG: hypothetical protein A2247_03775 [candidate division WOR-1 bacterium RIFOXYA2_FULL_41_14]OGC25171.1 MAG: hypothetical protein A2291_01975 [candidate division WOR-1 bacterium RIFOXYB2_FULL_42_35]OGC34727.1 MAG: hypothetical protein A2462_03290 [candidate division WOR-1 bacterium RIFOXYC2_FULL_41_25]
MKRFLILLMILVFVGPALAFKVGPTGVVNGIPYLIYNSTYGAYYGVIGKGKNFFNQDESLTLSAYLISNGGNGAYFVFSLPDSADRHDKMLGLTFDLTGAIGKTVQERYYGLGNSTPATGYTTMDNVHNKLDFQFSRAISPVTQLAADFFVANNNYTNISQGANALTPQITNLASNYLGVSFKLTLDKRDQVLDPHQGIYCSTNIDFGLTNAQYVKAGFDFRSYHTPIAADQVLATRFMLEQAGGDKIPIYEYPFLGGKDTMRGYTVNRWRDKGLGLVNLEYRLPTPVPFLKGLSTVFFFEAGKVGPNLSSLGFDNWATDAGLGLHLNLGGNVIVRGDFGHGTEGTNAYFFYNQAF